MLRTMCALTGLLILTACTPDAPRSKSAISGPRDDCELIVQRFGPPDAVDSTDYDVPRPAFPTKWVTYKKEHVRFLFIPYAGLGVPPPYRWRLIGTTDPRTKKPIALAIAVQRLAARGPDHGELK